MKSVRVHALLLLVALLVAFTTWTASDAPANSDNTTLIWERKPAEIAAIVYQSGTRTVELERRVAGSQSYVWGRETSPEPATAATRDSTRTAPDSASTGARDTLAATPQLRTDEYPTGKSSDALLEGLATLRVVRDLGSTDSTKEAAYGLSQPEGRLTIRFQDGSERLLQLGSRVIGGSDRYVLDTAADRIYVLGNNLIRPFEAGASELRLSELHNFALNQLASVTVRAQAGERRMVRRAGNASTPPSWTAPGSDQQDQAFANFMQQLGQLWINRYTPSLSTDSLESILRIEYFDDDDDSMDLLELFRTRGAPGATRTYFLRTRRTVVPGEVYNPLGERIEQDAATLFRPGPAARRQ